MSDVELHSETRDPHRVDRLSVILICSFFVLDQVFIVVLLTLLRPGVIWVGVIVWFSCLLILLGITARMRGRFFTVIVGWLVLSHLYFALILIATDFPILFSPQILLPLIISIALGQLLLILIGLRTKAKP